MPQSKRRPPGGYHHPDTGQRKDSIQFRGGASVSADQIFRRQAEPCAGQETEQVRAEVGIFTFRAEQGQEPKGRCDGKSPAFPRTMPVPHEGYRA
jgi:hypothetical protein